ncbi:hypothetical protein SAMN04488074_110225 [Lentzea albidocapillata subsp. violacea]|uniref:Uncharacterized protein n=1 Tax=Lentzea albidocapillata subsp. violacea TaxID=128104 RepID=A0A1G9JF20_9PSEU|nr:esterase-like activity of phytase family protein [Lentzea albidocapillata]SDL35845.1 hypothetical protein SAMN04488074_110225 [Lentzea albidocapillata subsp. violacea]
MIGSGTSEITALNDRTLLVLERDNQRGAAARTKKEVLRESQCSCRLGWIR